MLHKAVTYGVVFVRTRISKRNKENSQENNGESLFSFNSKEIASEMVVGGICGGGGRGHLRGRR